jgi:putative DNA primase/helicase
MNLEDSKDKKWFVENIPQELKALPIWVGFRFVPQKDKKPKKEPIDAVTGKHARSNDPKTWHTFDELSRKLTSSSLMRSVLRLLSLISSAILTIQCGMYRVAFGEENNLGFPELCGILSSKTGIHIVGKGKIPRDRKFTTLDVEMYSGTRFFTFTGDLIPGCPSEIRDVDISKLYDDLVNLDEANKKKDLLFKRIKKSNDSEAFFALYEGRWQESYPSQSEADLAFCNKLAFWTGKDPVLMNALFRQSGLMRPKWDEKHFSDGKSYGQVLIEKAIQDTASEFGDSQHAKQKKLTQGEIITRDCEETITEYLFDQQGNPYVVLPFEKHLEVCTTSSSRFRNCFCH